MGYHRLPAIANRLRINRGFDSAWYTDAKDYARILQKDWLLSKNVASFVHRSSRSLPKTVETREQQLTQLSKTRKLIGKGAGSQEQATAAGTSETQAQKARDFPNFRVGRIFLQHLPYKTYASVFAYAPPKDGPQAKYGIEKPVMGNSTSNRGREKN